MKQEHPYFLNQKLHTEVLEEKYGKISLQVLHDDDETREVLLTDPHNIARTYALTVRSNNWRNNVEICAVNDAIRAGEPIGQAFKTRGYTISKHALAVYTIALPEWLRHAFMMDEYFAKARITEFVVRKQSSIFQYGFVTEVYSPDFRNALVNAQDRTQVSAGLNNHQPMWVSELKQRVNRAINQIAPVLLFF
jgi:hypothetical protein